MLAVARQFGQNINKYTILVTKSTVPVGTAKKVKAVGFEGKVEFDTSKPDGTMRKLIDVSKLHSLGWTHKVEIEDGVKKLFEWYKESLT